MAKLGFFTICLLVMLYEGFGLHLMWGWYITKVFGGAQPGVIACIGLTMIVSMFKPSKTVDDVDVEKTVFILITAVLQFTSILVIGFILHFWV